MTKKDPTFRIKSLRFAVKSIEQTKTELKELMDKENFAETEKKLTEISSLIAKEIGCITMDNLNEFTQNSTNRN